MVPVEIIHGDCLAELPRLVARGILVDAVLVDPPYHLGTIIKRFSEASSEDDTKTSERVRERSDGYARLASGFMSKCWDAGDIAFQIETWRKVLEVMKPGAFLLAFGGTKGFHRMACAIEDAGFEIRNTCVWAYSTGFPKSLNVSKAIDKAAGAQREVIGIDEARGTPEAAAWEGWGTDLKPAIELLCMARKPISERTVAANVLRWGTGALNIDACRIGESKDVPASPRRAPQGSAYGDLSGSSGDTSGFDPNVGRWPANLMWDGSPEVEAIFPESAGQLGNLNETGRARPSKIVSGDMGPPLAHVARADAGSASRFFFSPKADKVDRWASKHPTVKPLELISYYVRMITPPGGVVLDCFAGTGTTGVAAMAEGFGSILIEREDEYVADIRERIAFYQGEAGHSLASKGRKIEAKIAAGDDLPLFGTESQEKAHA